MEAAVDDVCILASGILPPEELTAVMTDTGVQLHWQPATGASSYTVWRGMEFPATPLNSMILSTVTDTGYLDTTSLDSVGFYFVTANR